MNVSGRSQHMDMAGRAGQVSGGPGGTQRGSMAGNGAW